MIRRAIPLLLLTACSHEGVVGSADWKPVLDVPAEPIATLDILFVVDNSGSMEHQQEALIESASASLFGQLEAELGDAADLHVAVISTDVDAGAGVCGGTPGDGRFRVGAEPGACPGIDGTFLISGPGGANFESAIGDAFACQAAIGVGGCGFEQPLAAIERALDGTHAENAGFLRDDALLLVVLLTDEDDCSAFDPTIFDPDAAAELGPLHSFRCFEHGVVCDPDDPRALGAKEGCVPREDSAYLHPVSRYADLLRGLKDDPSLVMVAGIHAGNGPVVVVEDPDDPRDAVTLENVCAELDAFPSIRLSALAEEFPARYLFSSVCQWAMPTHLSRVSRSAAAVMTQRPCLAADPGPAPTCRGFAVAPGGARTPIEIALSHDEARCGHTEHATVVDADVPEGHRLVVECL